MPISYGSLVIFGSYFSLPFSHTWFWIFSQIYYGLYFLRVILPVQIFSSSRAFLADLLQCQWAPPPLPSPWPVWASAPLISPGVWSSAFFGQFPNLPLVASLIPGWLNDPAESISATQCRNRDCENSAPLHLALGPCTCASRDKYWS